MRFPPLAGRVSLVALAACLAAAAGPARAAYTVTFSELLPDVVARGSGHHRPRRVDVYHIGLYHP